MPYSSIWRVRNETWICSKRGSIGYKNCVDGKSNILHISRNQMKRLTAPTASIADVGGGIDSLEGRRDKTAECREHLGK